MKMPAGFKKSYMLSAMKRMMKDYGSQFNFNIPHGMGKRGDAAVHSMK